MRTIARRLMTLMADHGWSVGVIVGGIVGALFGGFYEPRASAHTIPARREGLYQGDRDD
jgi:hypothetical protein